MRTGVEPGSCVEKWLDFVEQHGLKVELVAEPDRYKILSSTRGEFYYFSVSDEIARDCGPIEERLRNMDSIRDKI